MTYCVAIRVNDGLVFAADTRTSASVDDVRVYNKLHVFEWPGERVFVLLSAGNLGTTQAVLARLRRDIDDGADISLRTVRHMFEAADYVGETLVQAQRHAAGKAQQSGVSVGATIILGGQIPDDELSLFMVYPVGNWITTSPETPFLQIGESKYGKPILDRIIRAEVSLEDAARCALVSLDSTMRSNISVGPPLDLAIVRRDELKVSARMRLDLDTPYYAALKESWARNLESVFRNLPRFDWELDHVSG